MERTPMDRSNNTQHEPGARGLYAIVDTLSGELPPVLHIFRSEPAALRFFGDVLQGDNNVRRHPEDHILVRFGLLDDNNDLIPGRTAVMQGRTLVDLSSSTPANSESATLKLQP